MPSSRINREKIRTRSQIADYIICKAIPDPLQIDPNSLPTLLWPKDDVSFTFPYLTTSKWLEKRASMFEKWSELASQNIPPKKLRIERLARVSLVLYVKHRTGKPHFTHVIKLLDFAGHCCPVKD
jgi:hypothetical protein